MARTFTITQEGESREFTVATGVGPPGADAEVTLSSVRAAVPNMVEVAAPTENDFIQRVSGSWVTRTIAQVKTALGLGTAAYTASTDYATALGADDNYVTDAEKTKLSNLSGTNTGDQDLSGYAPLASPTFTGTVTAPIHQATTTAGMVVKNSAGVTLLTIGKLDAGTGLSSGVAEGYATTASGSYSHAEGSDTTAAGYASHAEGYATTASGAYSHAEGGLTTASGSYSHAEGRSTTASGSYSHAGGRRAKATLTGSRVITDSQDADETSTLTDQLTYRFQNGYQFKGGAAVFSGAVSGSNLSGTNTGDQDLSGLAVKSANLSDLASASTARTNLGLGTLATQSGTFSGTSSGTNTGDETAATIATALNAGTVDSTAADTDRIAVVAPAGGFMLLSTLWTYIQSKLTAYVVAFTPAGNIAATNVQSAIEELDDGKADRPKQQLPISNTNIPNSELVCFSDATSDSMMGKWKYTSPDFPVDSLSLVFGNNLMNWNNAKIETARIAIRASIEYPAGVFTPVSFNGDRDGILSNECIATTGKAFISIPANTVYWVRVFVLCNGGLLKELPTSGVMLSTGGGGVQIGKAGVAATATVGLTSGAVTSVTLTSSGSGYPPNTEITCTVSGGGGSGSDVRAVVSQTGLIEKKFRIIAAGSGYSSPTIAIPGNATGAVGYSAIPTDLTLSGTLAQSINFSGYGPSAILATPSDGASHRSYIAVGDSITSGYYDSFQGYRGWVSRVSETYQVPIINFGISGGSAQVTFASGAATWRKLPIADGVTDAIVALGTNDLGNSRTSAQITDDITSVVTLLQNYGLSVSLCTIPPKTNTSNVPAVTEANRVAVNTWIRTSPLGVVQVFDTADALETSRNSGVWKASHMHSDYLHPNATGFDAMAGAFSAILK